MKQFKLAVLAITCASLIACSNMTTEDKQNVGMVVGGVAGGAAGHALTGSTAGTIGGAIGGGFLGRAVAPSVGN